MGSIDTIAATPVGTFLAGVGASFFLKLTTSVDDLVWFSPFLALSSSTPQRLRYCAVYVCVCVLVTAAALCLAKAAEMGFALAAGAIAGGDADGGHRADSGGFWDASSVLRVLASAVVSIYTVAELRGWLAEGNELPSMRSVCSIGWLSKGGGTNSPGPSEGEGLHIEFEAIPTKDAGEANTAAGGNKYTEEEAMMNERGESLDIHVEVREIDESNSMTCSAEDMEKGDNARKAVYCDEERCDATAETAMMNEEMLLDQSAKRGDNDGDATDDDDSVQAAIRAASRSDFALFAVALCGTIDDMILFAAVVAGRGIPWTSVLLGSLLAAQVVLVACWHISLYEPFANFVRRVPMWVLLGCISVYLLVGVFL